MVEVPRPKTFPWLKELSTMVDSDRLVKTLQGSTYVEVMGVYIRVPVPGELILPDDHNAQVEAVKRIIRYMAGFR